MLSAFNSVTFIPVFPGVKVRPFRGVEAGSEEPRFRSNDLVSGMRFPPISHISAYAANQGGLVL